MNTLSIIIVTWNCREYVRNCLRSIRDYPPAGSSDIIVVDNASTDGTVEMIRAEYPDVRIIRNASNDGFASANNTALREVDSKYVLLLNPDTEVKEGAIDALMRYAESHPEAWCVGPKILNTDGSLQRTGVRFPTFWNVTVETLMVDRIFPRSRIFGRQRELFTDPDTPRSVEYLQGSCLLIPARVFDTVGLLDDAYFMFFEESDFCYRIRESGGSVWYVPDAVITHHGGSGEGHYSEKKILYYHRGLLRFVKKYYPRYTRIFYRPVLTVRSIVRAILWMMVYAVMPRRRRQAVSSIRGYIRTLWKEN